MGLATILAGCVRPFYRKKADEEVADILREKDRYPDWKIESSHVYPDPRSRFADLSNPDHPPMPPDDPAAADLSPNPQKPGKAGVALMESTGYLDLMAGWDAENRAAQAAKQEQEKKESGNGAGPPPQAPSASAGTSGPQAPSASAGTAPAPGTAPTYGTPGTPAEGGSSEFPDPLTSTNGPRPFRLTLDQAVELGLINSREFQDRREDLYLQALPVTAERFAFSSQFFATNQLIRQRLGKFFPTGPSNNWLSNSTFGFSKLFSTGALLMLQFANRTVIELANPRVRHTISESTLNLDLIQPLLRGAGQAVTLEPLTLAERNLLYEIRDYAHFRKSFYVSIAAGADVGIISVGTTRFRNRPTAFNSGLGLIFGAQLAPGRGFATGVPASGNASPSGFLPTLLNAAQLEIERTNVAKLEYYLRLFRGFAENEISELQVQQVESQLLQSRNFAFSRNQALLDTLDRLKLQLGIPVNVPLQLDDEPLEPQSRQLLRFQKIILEFEAVRNAAERLATLGELTATRRRLRELVTTSALVRGTRFRTDFPRRWAAWERRTAAELSQRLMQFSEELRRLLASQSDLERQGQRVPQTLLQRIEEVRGEIYLARFEQSLRTFEALPLASLAAVATTGAAPSGAGMLGALVALSARNVPPTQATQLSVFREILNNFELILVEARNERVAQTHEQWAPLQRLCLGGIDLLAVDLDQAETAVVQAALTNRFELMNIRAQLVDAWRQIRVAANSLLGTFNVEYHLSSQTPAGLAMPLAFSGSRSRHQLVLNTQLPLVRILERNAYRASLIGWERWRRTLMAGEDGIAASVRSELRDLRVSAANYKIQQRAVEVAYLQVENAEDTFRAPPAPALVPGAGFNAGNAAALTQQLLGSQNTLRGAQLTLLSIWIDHLTTRMQLYRDLELMPLDPRGVWIDDVATCQCPSDLSPGRDAGSQPADGNPQGR